MFTLKTEGDESLSSKSSVWDFKKTPADSKNIEAELERLMIEEGGIGFSANQMGFLYRVFAMNIGGQTSFYYNPEIISKGETLVTFVEGCLSFPKLRLKVKRPDEITVRYQDRDGNVIVEELSGIASRCFQHELDHLDGVCFTDRVSKLTLDLARKKLAKSERKK
jgi:peptide deformylase